MLHVDDAQLHAYLDAELESVEPGATPRVESHLAGCSACRARLAEVQQLRLAARDLLRVTLPDVRAAPDLAALAERAAGRAAAPPIRPGQHRRTLHRRAVALGWAASILVALCAGWFAREARFRMAEPSVYASHEMQAEPSVRIVVPQTDVMYGAEAAEPPPTRLEHRRELPEMSDFLSPDHFFALSALLPAQERFQADPERATEPLRRWAERHPELADSYPAVHILRWFRTELERARAPDRGRG
jgi:hypothetical protein